MMNEAKVQEVLNDEVFVKNLLAMETPEEVQAALQAKDIDFSVEEIVTIRDTVVQKLAAGDELSDEDLENVAGGLVTGILMGTVIVGLVGIIGGAAIGGGLTGVAWATNELTKGKW